MANSIIKKENVKYFLEKLYKQKIEIISLLELGTGFMAVGFKVKFKIKKEVKNVVLRVLNHLDFSNDYPSDRMGSFWIQHNSAKLLPNHIKSLGVLGTDKNIKEIGIVDSFDEYIQILEFAEGEEYFADFYRIFTNNRANDQDFKRAILLSDYLAEIHKNKFIGSKEQALSLYKRHTRDYVGSRFTMDVLDTYPDKIVFSTWPEIYDLVFEIFKYREKIKNNYNRLSKIHGDLHPGNIRFQENNKFIILDASRVIWGEPADDVACLGINYLWFALRQTGEFKGVFMELYDVFLKNYLKKTKDKEIIQVLPLFYAIRSLVLNHPVYFNLDDQIRKKLLAFSKKILIDGNIDNALKS